jgi:hypothetical protein
MSNDDTNASHHMKYPVTRFKSLQVALKELDPFVRNGAHLQSGKPFKRLGGLRSRELLANWLLCVAVNHSYPDRLTFCGMTDPIGGDGVICDLLTEETWPTEHVMVPSRRNNGTQDVGDLILEKICLKCSKGGEAYARGKTLVVFLNAAGGQWFPNKVASQLPQPVHFEAVWVVGLQRVEDGSYVYAVTRLDLRNGNAPIWVVRIAADFDTWTVEPIQ